MASPAERRRRALAGLGVMGAALGFAAAWSSERRDALASPEPVATPAQATTPAGPADAGELVISGVSGTTASASLLRRARDGQIAGVILMGRSITSRAQVTRLTGSLQDAARAGGQPPLLITVDQEGGTVKRLRWANPTRPARGLAALGEAGVRAQGKATGRDLRAAGINVDLAPVADVPTTSSNFLGTRTFGTTPEAVARNACAFARGLTSSKVAASLKHFPGLGGAGSVNTDDGAVAIRQDRAGLEAGWAPYRACGSEPLTLTMVSSAAYPALTGREPALVSRATYDAARAAGAAGPFITDALEARALAGRSRVASRAVTAGAHLVLHTDERAAIRSRTELRGRLSQTVIDARAAPVRALREALAALAG